MELRLFLVKDGHGMNLGNRALFFSNLVNLNLKSLLLLTRVPLFSYVPSPRKLSTLQVLGMDVDENILFSFFFFFKLLEHNPKKS